MIEYIPLEYDFEVDYSKLFEICKGKKVGICATVQYLNKAKEIENKLKEKGIEIIEGTCASTGEKFQVLGCDITACNKKVDLFLFIGGGKFHPIWIQYKTNKKVFDVISNEFIDESEVQKLRNYIKGAYIKFLSANRVGIIVSLKQGQNRIELAKKLKKELGKKAYIFVMEEVDPNQLNDYPVDVWINTACPRLIDERDKFLKPIINVGDLLEMGSTFSQR